MPSRPAAIGRRLVCGRVASAALAPSAGPFPGQYPPPPSRRTPREAFVPAAGGLGCRAAEKENPAGKAVAGVRAEPAAILRAARRDGPGRRARPGSGGGALAGWPGPGNARRVLSSTAARPGASGPRQRVGWPWAGWGRRWPGWKVRTRAAGRWRAERTWPNSLARRGRGHFLAVFPGLSLILFPLPAIAVTLPRAVNTGRVIPR